MTDSFLHDVAVKCKPIATAKPTTIWVAILRVDKLPSKDITDEDFLWIKCHSVSLFAIDLRVSSHERKHPPIYDIIMVS